jgi:hypothetical protein
LGSCCGRDCIAWQTWRPLHLSIHLSSEALPTSVVLCIDALSLFSPAAHVTPWTCRPVLVPLTARSCQVKAAPSKTLGDELSVLTPLHVRWRDVRANKGPQPCCLSHRHSPRHEHRVAAFQIYLARGLTAQLLMVTGRIGSELPAQISRGLADFSARPISEFLSRRSSCRHNRASFGVGLYV